MPELPEVEQARKLFARCCVGHRIVRCHVEQDTKVACACAPSPLIWPLRLYPCSPIESPHTFKKTAGAADCTSTPKHPPSRLLQVFDGIAPDDYAKHLTGTLITGAGRKGKQLWVELEKRPWPLIHLGMTGSFAAIDSKGTVHTAHYINSKVDASSWPPKFWKFHMEMDDGCRVAFIAIRRFERVRLVADPPNEPPVSKLGFDPLSDMMPLAAFSAALHSRSGPVKGALLDQSFCAGVGNWIADEVLYQSRVHPETAVSFSRITRQSFQPCMQLRALRFPRVDERTVASQSSSLSDSQAAALHKNLRLVVKTACDNEADSDLFPADWLFHYRWTGKKASKTADGNNIQFTTGGPNPARALSPPPPPFSVCRARCSPFPLSLIAPI